MDWKAGHKEECKPVSEQQRLFTSLSEDDRKRCEANVERDGFHVVYGSTGPCCIVRDAQTNMLHESLSDQDVLFMGSAAESAARRASDEGADGSTLFTVRAADLPETTLARMRAGPQLI